MSRRLPRSQHADAQLTRLVLDVPPVAAQREPFLIQRPRFLGVRTERVDSHLGFEVVPGRALLVASLRDLTRPRLDLAEPRRGRDVPLDDDPNGCAVKNGGSLSRTGR